MKSNDDKKPLGIQHLFHVHDLPNLPMSLSPTASPSKKKPFTDAAWVSPSGAASTSSPNGKRSKGQEVDLEATNGLMALLGIKPSTPDLGSQPAPTNTVRTPPLSASKPRRGGSEQRKRDNKNHRPKSPSGDRPKLLNPLDLLKAQDDDTTIQEGQQEEKEVDKAEPDRATSLPEFKALMLAAIKDETSLQKLFEVYSGGALDDVLHTE